jgi:hypothetical protein
MQSHELKRHLSRPSGQRPRRCALSIAAAIVQANAHPYERFLRHPPTLQPERSAGQRIAPQVSWRGPPPHLAATSQVQCLGEVASVFVTATKQVVKRAPRKGNAGPQHLCPQGKPRQSRQAGALPQLEIGEANTPPNNPISSTEKASCEFTTKQDQHSQNATENTR